MKTRLPPRPDRRAFCRGAAATALVAALPRAGAAAPFDLAQLTALLAQRKSAQARFTEERYVGGLDGPLRASGTLSYTAPDRFTRRTTEPLAETMSVEGNTVTLERAGRRRSMALDAVPELTALIDGVRGTLSGNAALLQRHFETRVEGDAALWTLKLTPRRTHGQVREIQIAGTGGDLRSVELWLAGGDHSLMIVTPVPGAA
ncbi:MAG: outer membrane lipoprotein carrier protein LolA, partial [Burkholderiales bacterium]|nr:outer membrane lipoprotein carrier protein LolA [Burkholderiales bacterium]